MYMTSNIGSKVAHSSVPSDLKREIPINSGAEAVAKVANVPLPKSDVKVSAKEMKEAADTMMKDIQHFISSQERSVSISKDETSGHMIVKLIDPNTGEVIRTLPSEELLRIARSFEILGNKMVHQVA